MPDIGTYALGSHTVGRVDRDIIIADDLDDALGWARKVMEAIESREIGSAMSSSIS